MKNIPIFALEGAAFTGKTTLLNYLRENCANKVTTIPEASEYVGGDKHFPNVPFKTYDDARASTYFFIEIEKQRCRDALNAYEKHRLPVIMDRITPISSLIFYSLLAHTDPKNFTFIDSFYQHALEAFQIQVDRGNIVIPNRLIYLKPQNRNTFESRLIRGTKNEVFSSWKSYKFLDKKYQKLIQVHFKNNQVLILNSRNSPKNLKQLAEKVISFTESTSFTYLSKIFNNFLNENRRFFLNIPHNEEDQFSETINHSRDLINKTKHTL